MQFKVNLLLVICLFLRITSYSQESGNTPITDKKESFFTMGTYGLPPQLGNKKVNHTKLLEQLTDIHANTYHWLVTDIHSLKELIKFLPEARKSGLKIWVTLLPPSESEPIASRSSEPYKLDFEKWAVAIAWLSLREPHLVVWSIDDFVHNLDFFTPEYVQRFTRMAKDINPDLQFIPCCYYRQILKTPGFVDNYAKHFDGILYPYRAESAGMNLYDATKVADEIDTLRILFGQNTPIILDVYATGHSRLGKATTGYVKDVLENGLNCADGVLIFTHKALEDRDKYDVIKEAFVKKAKQKE